METIFERVAGLDVHKAQVTACVRVPAPGGGREQHLAEFPTTVRGLVTLRDWLEALGVKHVAMEATGVYWQPVWHVLEDAFELMLVNARHVKQVPGRKTDCSDAAWICQLMEAGLRSCDARRPGGRDHRSRGVGRSGAREAAPQDPRAA